MSIATKIIKKLAQEKENKVSIIVPIYNKVDFTLQMLGFLFNNTDYPYEIIIIDNNSTDNSEKLIKDFFKWTKPEGVSGLYVRNKENKGFSIANNQGARLATGKYLCFLNNDTLPMANWLSELVKCHETHKSSVTGAKLIIPGQGVIQHAGIEFDSFQYPYHKYFGRPEDYKEASEDKECSAVTGACLLVNKKEFIGLGGFNEDYWLGWEDIDLCNTYKQLNKKIWYASQAKLYHYESMSEGRYSKETDNWYYYSKKWIFKVKV
jgi:GT2 family glycosyltransferase